MYSYVVDDIIHEREHIQVWKGRLLYGREERCVAIKALNKRIIPKNRIESEIQNTKVLQHRNVADLYCVLEDPYHVLLFTEYGKCLDG
jgi:serine/threonine protein kinase